VLAGIAGDVCIVFTGHDAYMRGHRPVVPADCASEDAGANRATLEHLARLGADVRPSTELDVAALARAV
jgi:nicotinamidase-related amidase